MEESQRINFYLGIAKVPNDDINPFGHNRRDLTELCVKALKVIAMRYMAHTHEALVHVRVVENIVHVFSQIHKLGSCRPAIPKSLDKHTEQVVEDWLKRYCRIFFSRSGEPFDTYRASLIPCMAWLDILHDLCTPEALPFVDDSVMKALEYLWKRQNRDFRVPAPLGPWCIPKSIEEGCFAGCEIAQVIAMLRIMRTEQERKSQEKAARQQIEEAERKFASLK